MIIGRQIDLSVASTLALILSARAHAARPDVVQGMELDVIPSVILGGCGLLGGRGNIVGTLLGSLIIEILNNGLVPPGVGSSLQLVIKGVKDWLAKNRPDIRIKQTDFTDPAKVTQIAGDFLTANPDLKGLFAVWDQPALDALSAMRSQGINIPITTVDLGLQSAIEIAKGVRCRRPGGNARTTTASPKP